MGDRCFSFFPKVINDRQIRFRRGEIVVFVIAIAPIRQLLTYQIEKVTDDACSNQDNGAQQEE